MTALPSMGSKGDKGDKGDKMGAREVLRYALRYWRPHVRSGIALLALLLVQQGYGATLAYAMKHLVDDALPHRDTGAVVAILAVLAGAYIVTVVATVLAEWVAARITAAIMCDLRVRMFAQLQRLSLAYHSRTHSGDIVSRFSGDLGDVEKG